MSDGTMAKLADLREKLRREVAAAAGVEPARLGDGRPLTACGLDSLAAIELAQRLEALLGVTVPPADLLAGPTLDELASALALAAQDTAHRQAARPAGGLLPPPVSEGAAPALAPAENAAQPLSCGQRSIWLLHRLVGDSAAYHLGAVASLPEDVDLGALERACRALVARHGALRTTFAAPAGEPTQRVHPQIAWGLQRENVTALSAGDLEERLFQAVHRPFDLETGPLLRVAVFTRDAPRRPLLAFSVHHIAADFWSLSVLAQELGALYSEQCGGAPAGLPPLSAVYGDFVAGESDLLASAAGERLWSYWNEALRGAPPALDLPTDRPRPAVQTYAGRGELLRLGRKLSEAVAAQAAAAGTTLFTVLLAAFQSWLCRATGQTDLVTGAPAAGRAGDPCRSGSPGGAALAGLVGCCMNPLPLRSDLSGDPRRGEIVARVRRTVLDAQAHAGMPFGLLAERLQPRRDPSRSPIYQVLFSLQRAQRRNQQGLVAMALGMPGVKVRLGSPGLELESTAHADSRACELDLTLAMAEVEGELVAALRYNSDLFEPVTARRMLGQFHRLLEGFSAAADEPRLTELPLLSAAERAQLLVEWSAGPPVPPARRCLHDLFAAQARRRPRAPALVDGSRRLSYEELDSLADRLAHRLRRQGVGPEVRVGVCMERCAGMVAALLAVLKAGGAYVPLDPAYPLERLAFMLEDSRCSVLLAAGGESLALSRRASCGVIRLDRLDSWPAAGSSSAARTGVRAAASPPLPPLAGPANLAYVMYTSGSTGKPKGVAIEHRSAVQLVAWAGETFSPAQLAGVLASTSICFDLSIFELMATLGLGGTVVLTRDALALAGLAEAGLVTLVNTVPSAVAELAGSLPPAAATVTLCGEPLKAAVVERIFAQPTVREIWNLYGPTEATTYSTAVLLRRGEAGEPAIGRPLADNRVFVLDAALQPLPAGVPGELWLAGGSLARGYLERPALTAERFLPNPFAGQPGERMYRTGDLVRFRKDGSLDHLGRIDHQVKLRGFRIELGEVEAALVRHPAVHAAAAALCNGPADSSAPAASAGPRLAAWLVAHPGTRPVSPQALRSFLAAELPAYMVPAAFTWLPALPSTPNGKVDRRALPPPAAADLASPGALTDPADPAHIADAAEPGDPADPAHTSNASNPSDRGKHRHAPGASTPAVSRDPVEELVASIWMQVLGLRRPPGAESFFDLGGHSLLGSRIQSRLRQSCGVEMPLRTLFELPTVAGQARWIAAQVRGGQAAMEAPIPRLARPERLPLSPAQERLWFLQGFDPGGAVLNLANASRITGPLRAPALAASLAAICRRHETLRTAFVEVDGTPIQVVHPPGHPGLAGAPSSPESPGSLPLLDLSALPRRRRQRELQRVADDEANRGFDLARGSLLRARLLRLGNQDHVMLLVLHHLICDGASLAILNRELGLLYETCAGPRPAAAPLSELPMQYADFILWQRRWLQSEACAAQLAWWRRRLAAGPPPLMLPGQRHRSGAPRLRGAVERLRVPPKTTAALAELARQEGCTPFITLLACFKALLFQLTGEEDLVVGTNAANRGREELEGLIGLFINNLALRTDLSGDPSLRQLLRRVREVAVSAYAYQEVPYEQVLAELRPERRASYAPLFQAMFVWQSFAPADWRLPGLRTAPMALAHRSANFDLTLMMAEEGAGLSGAFIYDLDSFTPASIARLSRQLEALLQSAAADADQPISELRLDRAVDVAAAAAPRDLAS